MSNHTCVVLRPVGVRNPQGRSFYFLRLLTVLFAAAGCGRSDQDRFDIPERPGLVASTPFVQMNFATPQSSVTSVSVPFKAAQSAGNLNVVVVGWNDTTARIVSVNDTKGNAYQLAVGPTTNAGRLTQSIYYAKNVVAAAAGANAVNVSFTVAAKFADVRILEYGGMASVSPVDVTAAAMGNSAPSSTPSLVTTNASDLLFAANTVWTTTTGPGTGWTSRVITSPDGDIAEDRIVSTVGSYGVTAPLSAAGPWVMQAVAFKTAPAGPPTAPVNLAASAASSSQINLTWTNTSTTQTGVKIERSTDNVTFTQIAIAGATAASYQDTGLSASTTYSYRVRATNAAGDSAYSNVAGAATLPPPPTAPTGLSATAASSSQINLTWTNTSTTQTGVKIERSIDNVTFTQIAVAGAADVGYSDAGLSASTTYSYRVRATNASGDSAYSNVASAVTQAPPPPAAPTNLSATTASSSQIDLSWTNGSTAQTGVKIERSTDDVIFTQIAVAAAGAVNYSDTGLSASTTYFYRVRATNPSGDSPYSNVASATTQAPPPPPTAPTSLSATAASSSQINLAWTNTSTAQTGVKIERSTDNVIFTQIAVAGGSAASYSDTGLSASTTYSYRVRATNAAGDSAYSNVASAMTQSPPTTATPTLVQHVSSSTNPAGKGIPGNAFKFTLPNKVGAGNCLILGISYAWSASRTVSITDSNGNAWPSSPAVTVTGGQIISSVFVLPNANAGVTTITVTFDGSLLPFQYTISEFYNVATVSPVNGASRGNTTSGSSVGGTVASGSFTPGNNDPSGGNLIWTYVYDNANPGSGHAATNFAAGTGFTLLDADIAWGTDANAHHASEYSVQTAAAAINPGMTVTMTPAGDSFNAVSVALKAAPAGTAPAAGIRIIRISHGTREAGIPAAWKHQFPTSGNLIVAVTNENNVINITSVTDTKANSYSRVEPDGSEPQLWYAANAAPDSNLKLTLNVSGLAAGSSVVFYDIIGASPSPFDVSAGTVAANCSSVTSTTNKPSITPTTVNGLTLATMSLGQGPATGFFSGAPPGAIFDLVTYSGETDVDTMDNADAKAHLYNTDLSTENWNYTITPVANNSCSSTAVHFKGAP
jgi:Fibronectin type III domain